MLNQDEIYQIMLNLDIDDLQSLCSVDKQYFKLCQNGDFWYNKIVKDNLPLINNPSTINDYLKIKHANDKKLELIKKNYFFIEFNEDLFKILPKEYYDKLKFRHVDKVKLYFHLLQTKHSTPTLNYMSYIDNKIIELKTFQTSRGIILNMLFHIFYYYPSIIVQM